VKYTRELALSAVPRIDFWAGPHVPGEPGPPGAKLAASAVCETKKESRSASLAL